MTVRLGILALLDTKPGEGGELTEFLRASRELAVAEQRAAGFIQTPAMAVPASLAWATVYREA